MANIYTKTGDKGQTGLYGGSRVEKDSPKVECYGTLDEAISMLGLAYTETDRAEIKEYINHIQKRMFQAGAEVASDERGMEMLKDKISEADIKYLEDIIDECTEICGPQREFVVPGVNKSSAALHVARTIVRRAERHLVSLAKEVTVREELRKFVNRLSDACYAMARLEETYMQNKDLEALVTKVVKEALGAEEKEPVVEVKEVRLSPNIDKHDLEVKAKNANKFLEAGNKVKVSMRFRGRELNFINQGKEIMENFNSMLENSQIDKEPKMEGKNLNMFLSPKQK